MKSIKEQANEYADNHGFRVPYDGSDNFYDDVDVKASKEGFMAGANYVLEIVENYIQNLNLGDSVAEKFYKLDVIADIGLFIKQLKGE